MQFFHIKKPKGLLDDHEVFCRLFKQHDKLDCLRSPHLYKEHAVRFNVAGNGYGERRIICSREVSDLYDRLNRQYRYMINMKEKHLDNLRYTACKIREKFSILGFSDETIADMLVEYLYGRKKRYKQLLWFCYGQYVVNNPEKNIKVKNTRIIQCADCGEWIEIDSRSMKKMRCDICQTEYRKQCDKERKKKSNFPLLFFNPF